MGEKNTSPEDNQNNQSDKMNEHLNDISETPPAEEMDTNSDNNDNGDDEENLDDMTPEAFAALDNQLDALNSVLDDIEQKNDDIHSQLLQLLHANREIREQLQENKNNAENQSELGKQNESK